MFPNQAIRRVRKSRSALLLLAPLTAAGLGAWQLYRLQWKTELMERLDHQLHEDPIDFPTNLDEVDNLDYRRVRLQGTFVPNHEFLVGPRTLLREIGAAGQESEQGGPVVGVHVITPFKLASNGETILVNRGFLPDSELNSSRPANEVYEQSVNAIVRHLPKRKAPFVPDNDPSNKMWFWVDYEKMAKIAGTRPIMVDLCEDATPVGGLPIGGQTQITIRNEHLGYSITWFCLSAATLFMWFM